MTAAKPPSSRCESRGAAKSEPLSDEELDRLRQDTRRRKCFTITPLEIAKILATIDRERAARAEAEANYAACAHAISVEYVQDCGPSYPGPVHAVVSHIEAAVHAVDVLTDERDAALGKLAEAVEALEHIARWEAHYGHREAHGALARLRGQ